MALSTCPGLNTFHHNFNLKLFELAANTGRLGVSEACTITDVTRPFHSKPGR